MRGALLLLLAAAATCQPGGPGGPGGSGGPEPGSLSVDIVAAPDDVRVGDSFTVTALVYDNTSANATEPIDFFPDGGHVSLEPDGTIIGGDLIVTYIDEVQGFTFTGIRLGSVGDFELTVSADNCIPGTWPVSVSVGLPEKLFTDAPTYFINAAEGLNPTPAVMVTDAGDNVIVDDANVSFAGVSVAVETAPPDATAPDVPHDLAMDGGKCDLAGIVLFTVGDYRLAASLDGYPELGNVTIDVIVSQGQATNLEVTQQPQNKTADADTSTVIVELRDAGGNRASAALVSEATASWAGEVVAVGEAADGVLTFDDFDRELRTVGEYALSVTALLDTSVLLQESTAPFWVHRGPAAQLLFATQPGSALPGEPLSVAPVVHVADAGGNTVLEADGESVTLTASGSGDVLLGQMDTTRGVADFADAALSVPTTGAFRLTAASADFAAESDEFFGLVSVALSGNDEFVVTFEVGELLTVEVGEAPESALVVTPTSDSASFSPESVTLDADTLSQEMEMTALVAGSFDVVLAVSGADEERFDEPSQEWSAACATGYVGAACTVCAVHYYHEDESSTCRECPEGALCDGNDEPPTPEAGYWSREAGRVDLCLPASACLGGFGEDTCEAGYEGTRCSECVEGSYRYRRECRECPSHRGLRYVALVVVLLLVGAGLYYGYRLLAPAMEAAGPVVSILVDFMQTLSVFSGYPFWPPALVQTLEGSSAFNLNPDLLAVECSGLDYEFKWTFTMLVPVAVAGLLPAAAWAALTAWRAPAALRDRCIAFSMLVLQLVFLTCTTHTLAIFDCVEYSGGEAVMEQLPSAYCVAPLGNGAAAGDEGHDEVHARLLPRAWVSLLAYTVGIPALFYAVLRRHRAAIVADERAPRLIRRWGVLFRRFKRDHSYWLLVVLARKLLVAYASAIMSHDQASQLALMALVVVVSLVAQVSLQPFATPKLMRREDTPRLVNVNLLESASLSTCFVILLSGISFSSPERTRDWTAIVVEVLVVGLVVATVGYFATVLVWIVHATARVAPPQRRLSLATAPSMLWLPDTDKDLEIRRLQEEITRLRLLRGAGGVGGAGARKRSSLPDLSPRPDMTLPGASPRKSTGGGSPRKSEGSSAGGSPRKSPRSEGSARSRAWEAGSAVVPVEETSDLESKSE